MIHPDFPVDIPQKGTRRQKRRDGSVYLYLDPAKVLSCPPKHQGKKSVLIGEIMPVDGKEMLIPNDAYFELMDPDRLRDNFQISTAGGKPDQGAEQSAEPMSAAETDGLTLLGAKLLKKTGFTACLKEALGNERAIRLQACALYLAGGSHSTFAELDAFVQNNFNQQLSSGLTREQAQKLFVSVGEDECKAFYTAWNKKQQAEWIVLSDAATFAEFPKYATVLKRQRCDDNLLQDSIAVFCDGDTGIPLYILKFEGQLLDSAVFRHVMSRVRDFGIDEASLSLALDGTVNRYGVTNPDNLCLMHFNDIPFVIRVACDGGNDTVSEAFSNKCADLSHEVRINRETFLAGSLPFALGGLEGRLHLYRDSKVCDSKVSDLNYIRAYKRAELAGFTKIPDWVTDFDRWAKSYSPCFKVEKDSGGTGFQYEESSDGFDTLRFRQGGVALFCNDEDYSAKESLRFYRFKETLEADLDGMKNCINDGAGLNMFDDPANGRLLALFGALTALQAINYRLKIRFAGYGPTFSDVVEELKAIKFVRKQDGTWQPRGDLDFSQGDLVRLLLPDD